MHPRRYNSDNFFYFFAALTFLIAASVLVGWQTDVWWLKGWARGITPMNPMTAVIFMFCGLWVLASISEKVRLAIILSTIISLFGFIHLATYFYAIKGIRADFWLFSSKIESSGMPNLIAPNTALNFFLLGCSMLIANSKSSKLQLWRQGLILISFLLVYISLLGYLFHIQPAYRFGGFTPMALTTSATFMLLMPVLLLYDIRYGIAATLASPLRGGRLMRRFIPFILIFPPATGYLRLIGERKGLYPAEVGVELFSVIFTIALLVIISFYAGTSNKKTQYENNMVSLMLTLHEGVLQIDNKGLITFCNPAFDQIMGYEKGELIGASALYTLVPAQDREIFTKRLRDRNRGISEEYKAQLLTKNGKRIWAGINTKPFKNEWGNFNGSVVSIRDITEETLQNQDLQAFSSSAAHDLNSPLANIQNLFNMIETHNLDEEQKQLLAYIGREAKNMRALLNDLLSFSQLGASEMPMEEIDIALMVEGISQAYAGTSVKIIVAKSLPSVQANRIATSQLLTNLISNAVKYSSKASQPVVEMTSYLKNEQVWFRISDNGIGLPENKLPELFTPFKRFTDKFEGNGLGLAIAKRVIEKHNGQIYAENNADGGLSFHFTLSAEQRTEDPNN